VNLGTANGRSEAGRCRGTDQPFGASPLLIVEEATAAPIGGAACPA
jgi:hypothetical protein